MYTISLSRFNLKLLNYLFLSLTFSWNIYGQDIKVPAVHSNIEVDEKGKLYYVEDGTKYYEKISKPKYTIQSVVGTPKGTDDGIEIDFGDLEGQITYGLIPYNQVKHPLPIYRFNKKLKKGKIAINIKDDFKYPYDFVNWKENKKLSIGYRFTNPKGKIIFDGVVSVKGDGPFTIAPAIYEGPFVSNITDNSVDLWFSTTLAVKAKANVDGQSYNESTASTFHHWKIDNLQANKEYTYNVEYDGIQQEYHFKTAPSKGSREAFVFGYSSDSRQGHGSGERDVYGANTYIIKKIAALAYSKDASFIQFTGDLINGYLSDYQELQLQYTNWKKAVEPYWHYIPFYTTMGNHEILGKRFVDEKGKVKAYIGNFPYATNSSEAAYAEAFVNPISSLESEDNSKYDPNSKEINFPSYKENVYSYTYDNVAMVVLNSDYWYAPSLGKNTNSSGGLHGYIMDNQLKWLKKTIAMYEKDKNIDHIFVTQHTPAFPNGGHARDDMWYFGNNEKRPFVAGKAVDKGIIQRRDQYLDILINKSKKVVAMLTGDEHNYNWLKLTKDMPIYPDNYPHKKLKISRPIYQVNNGAAGAPYYAQEVLPWSAHTQSFSVENAVCLFYVEGNKVEMVVWNPDTLNEIDRVQLR
ncbi:metallophosphoesterase [Flammeovirga sp. EKP202]|uniref:metallophosphoesterase family protein n=1 Tax=Flammeovirga sp. EKP202 TaxID=2770592 RepID=UPI00165FC42C